MNRDDAARRRREQAAARYRPDVIDTLVVVEGPPSALDRYFYFEDVATHDSLFRHVVLAVTGERPTRDKAPWLDELQERGWFVIGLSEDPFDDRSVLSAQVPALVRRCRDLAPRRILLVGVVVYDVAFLALRDRGLPVVDARIPYPGSGQQNRFLDAMRELTSPEPWR